VTGVVCGFCQAQDPDPGSPCLRPGLDHNVGWRAGCAGCGRLREACAGPLACTARQGRLAPLRLAVLRLRLAWRDLRGAGPGRSS
jgi:hypothetical protein